MNREDVKSRFNNHLEIVKNTFNQYDETIIDITEEIIRAYKRGNKVLIAGNGGSAADSQHIATELVNKLYKNKKALSAISLSADTSILTAWSNDVGFDHVFERQVEAHGRKGDILIAITTSGNSANVINAVEQAKEIGMVTIGFLGRDGGKIRGMCKYEIIISSDDVARIQEAHELIYHIICEFVEKEYY